MRGNGNPKRTHTNANLIKCVVNVEVIDHALSIFEFKKPLTIVQVKYTAVNITAIGITTRPISEYIFGKIFDIVDITPVNIWHVQHEEKNCNASFISTGATLRHTEKPAMPATEPIIIHGKTAPAEKGRNEKNTIKNFFNLLILFNYITIL